MPLERLLGTLKPAGKRGFVQRRSAGLEEGGGNCPKDGKIGMIRRMRKAPIRSPTSAIARRELSSRRTVIDVGLQLIRKTQKPFTEERLSAYRIGTDCSQ